MSMKKKFVHESKWHKFVEAFNLKQEQKIKLVELILIVGTLSATLNKVESLIWMYPWFALLSIGYLIVINVNIKKVRETGFYKSAISFTSLAIAITFSGFYLQILSSLMPQWCLASKY